MKPHQLKNPESGEVLATADMTTEDAAGRNINLKAIDDPHRWISEDEPPVTPVPKGQFL